MSAASASATPDSGSKQPGVSLSELEKGATALERSCTLRLESKAIKAQVTKILLGEVRRQKFKGFSKNTKVVPQPFRRRHERTLVQDILMRSASPALAQKLRSENIAIMPGLALGEHIEEDGDYVVECRFEIRPEIPPAKLEGLRLRRPIVDASDAELAKVIKRIREQSATYSPAGREAMAGDRVKAELDGKERVFIVGHAQTPPPISKAVTGRACGDEVVIKPGELGPVDPEAKSTDLVFKISEIDKPEVPELDLELIKRFMPEAPSIEGFKEEIKKQLKSQGDQLAHQIMVGRALDALERATEEFELPQRSIDMHLKERLNSIRAEAQQRNLDVSKLSEDNERAEVALGIRTALVLNQYASEKELKVEEKEMDERLDQIASNQENPEEYRKQMLRNPNQLRQIEEAMMRGKVSDKLYADSVTEEVTMAIEELERILQSGDPETRRFHTSGNKAAEPSKMASE